MKSKFLITIALLIGLGLGAGGLALAQTKSSADTTCGKPSGSETHQVMIMDSRVDDTHIAAKLCDTITFTNMDNVAREIAFGPHEHHVAYDGIAEKVLNNGQSFTITLNQTGNFHWHDHVHDEMQGSFTVTK